MTLKQNIEHKVKEDLVETIKFLDRRIEIYTNARNGFLKDLRELNDETTDEKQQNKELLESAKK